MYWARNSPESVIESRRSHNYACRHTSTRVCDKGVGLLRTFVSDEHTILHGRMNGLLPMRDETRKNRSSSGELWYLIQHFGFGAWDLNDVTECLKYEWVPSLKQQTIMEMKCFLPSGRALVEYISLWYYSRRQVESRLLDDCDSGEWVIILA